MTEVVAALIINMEIVWCAGDKTDSIKDKVYIKLKG